MDRRNFLISSSCAAMAAFTSPITAQSQSGKAAPLYNVLTKRGPNGHTIYVPEKPEPSPAILLLHGSEGRWSGWVNNQAMVFAMRGFVALSFPYGTGGNPWHASDILNVDLEKTAEALAALRNDPHVAGRRIGLYGSSRGAEHALLLTSLMARDKVEGLPDAVAVHSPSDTIVGAFIGASWKPKDREVWDPSKRAWRWRGSSDGLTPTTPIEIERYSGPLFISHGEADDVWTVECTRRLEARLKSAGRNPEIHYYPGEGHGFKAETANLQRQRLTEFFSRHLG